MRTASPSGRSASGWTRASPMPSPSMEANWRAFGSNRVGWASWFRSSNGRSRSTRILPRTGRSSSWRFSRKATRPGPGRSSRKPQATSSPRSRRTPRGSTRWGPMPTPPSSCATCGPPRCSSTCLRPTAARSRTSNRPPAAGRSPTHWAGSRRCSGVTTRPSPTSPMPHSSVREETCALPRRAGHLAFGRMYKARGRQGDVERAREHLALARHQSVERGYARQALLAEAELAGLPDR